MGDTARRNRAALGAAGLGGMRNRGGGNNLANRLGRDLRQNVFRPAARRMGFGR